MIKATELLAPAKDLECGIAAIDSGADAVYIGAPRFGARAKAGNDLDDIAQLARYAHQYWARVYVTVNTLLYNHELPEAVHLIHQLYERDVDAIIVQDMGLLESDLPPIPLIASTQMHNTTPEKVAFLEAVGFRRVILARELSLTQIRAIHQAAPNVELEFFVHGALCVSFSGQCYMSYAIGGRSGNRGECAQPCRRRYTLVDRDNKPVIVSTQGVSVPGRSGSTSRLSEGEREGQNPGRHWLSLRDLNLSAHLDDLLDAGITSFKIEGRLKDVAYIKNVVSFYRQQLDAVLVARGWLRTSSGYSVPDFTPDIHKTFNRGYTTYFLHGRTDSPGAIDTPKMIGEFIGIVTHLSPSPPFHLSLDRDVTLQNGDGVAFFDASGELQGTVVNGVEGRQIALNDLTGICPGTSLYRNHDHAFLTHLVKAKVKRSVAVVFTLDETDEGFILTVEDEDGNTATEALVADKILARKPEMAQATVVKQLQKTGDTVFECTDLYIHWQVMYFLPVAELNDLRRRVLEKLGQVREVSYRLQRRYQPKRKTASESIPYPETRLTFKGNVLNEKAAAFYRRHGVTEIEPAAESGLNMRGQPVMRTRYCLKHQLGLCDGTRRPSHLKEPLYLVDEDGHRYPLHFDCAACEMEVEF
ncbi:MAG: U32 family peptidase [Anaerolineae bacterium]|nr:U32 family peptidase [Anaerolineae bacterium]